MLVTGVSTAATPGSLLAQQCHVVYELKAAPGSAVPAPRVLDVILIHGFVWQDAVPGGCEAEVKRDPGHDYFYTDTSAAGAEWTDLRQKLNGRKVGVLTYKWDTYSSIDTAGDNLAALVVRLGNAIAPKLILVGHSMGGLVAMRALTGPNSLRGRVVRVITLATPHRGTSAGYFIPSVSTSEVRDPAFLNALRSQRHPDDGLITFALGGRVSPYPSLDAGFCLLSHFYTPDLAEGGDCVVPVESAYDGYNASSSSPLRIVTPLGWKSYVQSSGYYPGSWAGGGYDHHQMSLDYTWLFPTDPSKGRDLFCKVRELLGTGTLNQQGRALSRGDIRSDCTVDAVDLSILLSSWGRTDMPPADLNQDSVVDVVDFSILLSNWGVGPVPQ